MPKPSSKIYRKRIGQLLLKYLTKEIKLKESIELSIWVCRSKRNKKLFDKVRDPKFSQALLDSNYALIERELEQELTNQSSYNTFRKRSLLISATILLAFLISIYFVNHKRKIVTTDQNATLNLTNSAGIVLTLSNGTQLNMDSISDPITQGENILKKSGSELTYVPIRYRQKEEGYNTITTMSGKNFKVVLQDGSKVWLNACSSIHYPTSFNNKLRKVEITGEAFFEIAPINDTTVSGHKVPFIVSTNGIDIRVIGTQFNVLAYPGEEIRASLLEGSIEVNMGVNSYLLKPGQQIQVSSNRILKLNSNFDEEEILAWKKNLFFFNDLGIEAMMQQISRWYNVHVVYKDVIMDTFIVTIPRNISLEQLLKILELSNHAHFKLENNTVIVSK